MSIWDYIFKPRKAIFLNYEDREGNSVQMKDSFAVPKMGEKFYLFYELWEVLSIAPQTENIYRVVIKKYHEE